MELVFVLSDVSKVVANGSKLMLLAYFSRKLHRFNI
jgi:hypothetical protein